MWFSTEQNMAFFYRLFSSGEITCTLIFTITIKKRVLMRHCGSDIMLIVLFILNILSFTTNDYGLEEL